MPRVINKTKLCEINLSDVSVEQIGGIPFYERYDEIKNVFQKHLPNYDFELHFAHPSENRISRTIEWFYKAGNDIPIKLLEAKECNPSLYETVKKQRESIAGAIKDALANASQTEAYYLSSVVPCLNSDEADNWTYSVDGQILFGIWGMKAKPGHQLTDAIREDVMDKRIFSVYFKVKGEGSLSFDKIERKNGYILRHEDVPDIMAKDGWKHVKWEPDIPQGTKVLSDLQFTAVVEEQSTPPTGDTVHSDDLYRNIDTTHEQNSPSDDTKIPHDPPSPRIEFNVSFISESGGKLHGPTHFTKLAGDVIKSQEVPIAEAAEGFEFVGWNREPDGYTVHENITFLAQFKQLETSTADYVVEFRAEEGGELLGQTRYSVPDGKSVNAADIPEPNPDEGFEFIGWDKEPIGFVVHSDTYFVAKFRKQKRWAWWPAWLGPTGCLSALLNWLLLILGLLLLFWLLWCFVFNKCNFNFCECEQIDTVHSIVDPDPTPPTPSPTPTVVACNDFVIEQTSNEPKSFIIPLGKDNGIFQFEYATGNAIPDRIEIFEGNNNGGKKIFSFYGITGVPQVKPVNFNQREVFIQVTPNSDPGTFWAIKVNCP